MNFAEKLYLVAAAAMLIATGINLYGAHSSFRATERASQLSRRIQQAQDESLSNRIREHRALEKCTQFILHGCTDNTIEKFMKAKASDEL